MPFPTLWNCGAHTRPSVCRAWPVNGAYDSVALLPVSWSANWGGCEVGSGTTGPQDFLLHGEMENSWNHGQKILILILFSLFPGCVPQFSPDPTVTMPLWGPLPLPALSVSVIRAAGFREHPI